MPFLYETTCHIISGIRNLGERSYNMELDRHLNKMGEDNWELVSVQKSMQVLAIDRELASRLTDEQLGKYNSPRDVFVFFWRKPRDLPVDSTDEEN